MKESKTVREESSTIFWYHMWKKLNDDFENDEHKETNDGRV